MMLLWSLVSWAQAWMTGRASFYVTRALIGTFEGGFIPGAILFATYFYKTRELSVRLAAFWSTLNVCCPRDHNAVPGEYYKSLTVFASPRSHTGRSDHILLVGGWHSADERSSWEDRMVLAFLDRRASHLFDWTHRTLHSH